MYSVAILRVSTVFETALRNGVRCDVKRWNCPMSAYTEHGTHNETQAALERMTVERSDKPQTGVFKHRTLEERTLDDDKLYRWADCSSC